MIMKKDYKAFVNHFWKRHTYKVRNLFEKLLPPKYGTRMLGFAQDQDQDSTVNERDAQLPGVSNSDSHNDQLLEVREIFENDLSFGRIEGNLEPNAQMSEVREVIQNDLSFARIEGYLEPNAQMSEVSEGSGHELTFANIGANLDDPNVQLPEVSEEIERNPTFARIEEFSDTY